MPLTTIPVRIDWVKSSEAFMNWSTSPTAPLIKIHLDTYPACGPQLHLDTYPACGKGRRDLCPDLSGFLGRNFQTMISASRRGGWSEAATCMCDAEGNWLRYFPAFRAPSEDFRPTMVTHPERFLRRSHVVSFSLREGSFVSLLPFTFGL